MQITVCPNCQTSLYITDEQLRQAQGKVKCGRCLTIFNALEHLMPASEKSMLDLLSVKSSEEQSEISTENKITESVQVEELNDESDFNFSFSLPAGSSSALSGVSVRDTMRVATDGVYSSHARQDIFSSEEISLDDPDEQLDKESLLSDFVLALDDGEEEVTEQEELQNSYDFQPEQETLAGHGTGTSYILSPEPLVGQTNDGSFEEKKLQRATRDHIDFVPLSSADSSKTERLLCTGIVAALCCLVVQIIGSFFISIPASHALAPEIKTVASSANFQGNRLLLNIKASQPDAQIKAPTMLLSLMDANKQVVLRKAVSPEHYLPMVTNKDGYMLLDMTLFARQPIDFVSFQVQWLPN